ncbi:tolloid-like protein 2 [Trichonephila clavipes]|nr:tolloid-like protein 2 [Trichonephila clavipes]
MQRISIVLLILLLSRCVDVSGNGELSLSKLLRYAREVNDDCNLTITVSGNGGTLSSPGYPDKYPGNMDCRWLLTSSDPNATLFLRIETLQIEPDTNCKLDYLQVYLGASTLAPALEPMCGNIKDRVIKTNSSTLLVVFHSDPVYEDRGFSVDYFTQSAGDCKTSLTEGSGVIRSPGFPNFYPDKTDCWTLITVNPDKKIALNFDSIDLEYGDNCTFDYVQIYDGATRESTLLGQICSRQDRSSYESTSNSLLLHFHSDESVNKKGYRAHYSAIDKRSLVIGDCLWDSGPTNGTVASPNYPAQYPSLSNCSIWLQAPEDQRICIEIDSLVVEIEVNCSYDYLKINDGPPPNTKTMGTLCGRKNEPKNLTSTTNEVQIVFHSDDFAEFSGFKLRYWFQKNETETTAFDPVSEFDRGRIVAYQDYGLSFRKIGSRVGRNQTTVMRICDRWMQEGTTDRRGRSYPPQCTASLSARTIRRRLQLSVLSARHPLLGLPLSQNYRHLRRQWCDKRRIWVAEWNEVVYSDESRICLQHHDGRIRFWRHRGEMMLNSCVMHRHTGPAPGIMVWGGIGYHYRIPLVHIAGTLNSQRYVSEVLEPVVLPYLQGLATAIFQQDNARPHVARIVERFVNHQIELLPWLSRSPDLSPMENMWSMVAQRLTQITPPAATPDQLWQRVEAAWSAGPQEHIQSLFESMPRRVAAVISNNGGYSGY